MEKWNYKNMCSKYDTLQILYRHLSSGSSKDFTTQFERRQNECNNYKEENKEKTVLWSDSGKLYQVAVCIIYQRNNSKWKSSLELHTV